MTHELYDMMSEEFLIEFDREGQYDEVLEWWYGKFTLPSGKIEKATYTIMGEDL